MNYLHIVHQHKNRIIFFIFVFLFVIFGSFLFVGVERASAATYYVSTTGTDDASHGTGTGTDAWLTLDYALTGSRVAMGDTINIEAGTYSSFYGADTYISPTINTASGSGPVIIQAYPTDAVVTLDMPVNTSGSYAFLFLNSTRWGEFTFKHINFTNSNAVASQLFWIYGHNLTLEDCQITFNAAVTRTQIYISTDTEDANLIFRRTKIINGPSGSRYIISNGKVGANVTLESSLFYDQIYYILALGARTNVTVTNSTFFTSYAKFYMPAEASGSIFHIKNNIFYANTDTDYRPFVTVDAISAEIIANPDNWDVTNNIWYWSKAPVAEVIQYQYFIGGHTHIDQVDSTNHYINPQFTATSTDDYTIQVGSDICGHGLQASLPADGDVTGVAWTGNDIGAYKCPSSSTGVTLLDKVAFVGDSIMLQGTVASTFTDQTGLDVVAVADTAISGAPMQKIFDSIDAVMINSSPSTVFLSIGINNLALQTPALATNTEYANYILEIMEKIEDWGATPIWLGIGTLNNYGGLPDTPIPIINAAVEAGCVSHGWTCDAYYDQMTFNSSWQSASPNGYYDTNGDVHPNTAGYQLIGEFAEYLYYTHHTMGTDEIDVGAGARVYSNGKFRDQGVVSGITADLTVTPAWGGFTTGDYSYWLDVGIDSWLTSGTYNKQWTASSTLATTTIYTIGDLAPSKYYKFKLDGADYTSITGDTCASGICLSDSLGNLTFTYAGGYSTHTFALEQNTSAPTNIGFTSITADSTSQLTILADTAVDSDPGLSATPYWFDETTGGSGATDSSDWQSSATYIDSGLSTNTQYTYRVKARDGNTNESDYSTTLSKYTLAPTPSNLSATASRTSISLSVSALDNASSGSSGYYFSRNDGTNSGWIQTNTWDDTSLSCGTSYTYSVKYRNGDGTETSVNTITKSTSGCSGGGSYYIPSVGLGSTDFYFKIGETKEITGLGTNGINILVYVHSSLIFSLVNSNTKYNLEVLDLDTATGLIKIKLADRIFYLSPGKSQKFDLDGGGNFDLQLVYNKLKVNQIDLTLLTLDQPIPTSDLLANGSLVKTPNDPAVYLVENGMKRHIINEDVFIAQGFSWSDIIDVPNLDNYPSGEIINITSNKTNNPSVINNYVFTVNLPYGSASDDVLRLQKFLNANGFIVANTGFGSPGHETKIFGRATRAALIKFQNKYKKQILEPLGLSNGTGIFGPATREFIKNNFSY